MPELAATRCAQPRLTARAISTYTVLGFIGYGFASLASAVLASQWQLTLGERLTLFFAPPLAFIAVVTVASAIAGRERIVFYQTATAGVAVTAAIATIAGMRVARLVDLVTLGIAAFLVFGRLGCFAVGCCHGTLGRGVVYGHEHVRAGFWERWQGRPLWPVQLVESAATALLVVAALILGRDHPGTPAIVCIVAYGVLRFGLELVRGDAPRPYLRGVSEAQWFALLSAIACAIWRPGPLVIGSAAVLAVATAVLAACARRRELFLPPHLHELDELCTPVVSEPTTARRESSLGVAVTRHVLPDRRIDWVLSASHPAWSAAAARRLASALWIDHQVIEGRTPGVVHVVSDRPAWPPAPKRR